MGLIATPKLFQQLWGIWPIETIHSDVNKKLYLIYRVLVIGWYSFFNMFQAIASIRLLLEHESLERVSKCLSVVITLILMLTNSIIYQKNRIPNMCLEVSKIEKLILNNPLEREVYSAYQSVLKRNIYLNRYIVGSSILTFLTFVGISAMEVVKVGPDYWKFDNVSFMHELYLPFDRSNFFMGIIFVNVWTSVESLVVNGVIQTTFYALVMYGALRFKVLRIRLKRLNGNETEEGKIRCLKKLLLEHQECIRFIENLNNATTYVLLMSFLLNSVKVASVIFPLMALTSFSDFAFPLIYSSMLVSEVFFLSWTCNEVQAQSLDVADSIFETSWYRENKEYKMLLQIMIMRAQRPVTMRIGPFGTMTTGTIMTTLKAAYSYATLMMNQ
ncbi:odorant receptor 67c-like [Euwallacea fornicatus]|uniref:odorant receptor 67c-like n=1 Tax=Euwallacea fornicatus TaxID=995702 RepID=UPI00339059D2